MKKKHQYKKIKGCSCRELMPGDLAELRLISTDDKVLSSPREYLVVALKKYYLVEGQCGLEEKDCLFYECLYLFNNTKKTLKIEDTRANFYPDPIDLVGRFCLRKILGAKT